MMKSGGTAPASAAKFEVASKRCVLAVSWLAVDRLARLTVWPPEVMVHGWPPGPLPSAASPASVQNSSTNWVLPLAFENASLKRQRWCAAKDREGAATNRTMNVKT